MGPFHADEEEELWNEECEAQVLVDGGALTLHSLYAAESGDTQSQTHQGYHHAHPGHNKQNKGLHTIGVLRTREKEEINKKKDFGRKSE